VGQTLLKLLVKSPSFALRLVLRLLWMWNARQKWQPRTEREEALVERLRNEVLRTDLAHRTTDRAAADWLENQRLVASNILQTDPRHFAMWRPIRRTMAAAFEPYLLQQLISLKSDTDWHRWSKCLAVPEATGPYLRFPLDRAIHSVSIQHAYHLMRFVRATGKDIAEFNSVLEFGGGFGNLSNVAKLSGSNAIWTIFDLPIFSALQNFFLSLQGSLVSSHHGNNDDDCVYSKDRFVVRLVSDLAILQHDNWEANPHPILFIATWSFSETPLEFRKLIEPILNKVDGILIAYQSRFLHIDNGKYFTEMPKSLRQDFTWTEERIDSIPGTHRYLFGVRNAALRSPDRTIR
jgi:hypothetical protein